ncbi:MAG TPA: NADH:flavin oxidoreductase [Noviherbaspirillum sp.]|nr:NADH:flavin oxidoreductase [Noviherbaspirillum sp.]
MSGTELADGPLFEKWERNGLELANRLAVAPMTRVSATPLGVPTPAMVRYYTRFARGGFGLVITEGIYTDRAYAQGYANQPGLTDAEQLGGWRSVVDAVHAAGGKIVAQLMHAGALAQGNRFRGEPAGPSAVAPKGLQMPFYGGQGPYRTPLAMSPADIRAAIDGFASAANLARAAGFDGVEIHGANGYLLDQFLTGYTNRRSDDWGGTIERRVRLCVGVAQAVRAAVGTHFPVGMRISQAKVNDFEHKWPEGEDGARIVFGLLADVGLDFLHVTEFEAWKAAFGDTGPSLVALARRYAPGVTMIANGSLHAPQRALQLLEDGADIIALGRGALANPDWPNRLAGGEPLAGFDRELLAPLADIKPSELAQRGVDGRREEIGGPPGRQAGSDPIREGRAQAGPAERKDPCHR